MAFTHETTPNHRDMMPNVITPESVRPALKLSLPGPWTVTRGYLTDARGQRFMEVYPEGHDLNAHDLAAMAPDLACAYLAEHARADAAEAEANRLAANATARERLLTRRTDALRAAERRIEALEAAAAPDWRPGVPSVEDVRAHEARGGLWLCRMRLDSEAAHKWNSDDYEMHWLRADGSGRLVYSMADFDEMLDGFHPHEVPDLFYMEHMPLGLDGTPAPWPVHGDDSHEVSRAD